MDQKNQLSMLFLFKSIPMVIQSNIHKKTHHLELIIRIMQKNTTHLNLQFLVLIPPLQLLLISSSLHNMTKKVDKNKGKRKEVEEMRGKYNSSEIEFFRLRKMSS